MALRLSGMVRQPEEERRASLAGANLFFGVLLGANLGSVNTLQLYDYVFLTILLAGAVMGLFTITISRRPRHIWTTLLLYVAVLTAVVAIPELRPERMEREIERVVATLAIWMAILFGIRLTPSATPDQGETVRGVRDSELRMEDELDFAPADQVGAATQAGSPVAPVRTTSAPD